MQPGSAACLASCRIMQPAVQGLKAWTFCAGVNCRSLAGRLRRPSRALTSVDIWHGLPHNTQRPKRMMPVRMVGKVVSLDIPDPIQVFQGGHIRSSSNSGNHAP